LLRGIQSRDAAPLTVTQNFGLDRMEWMGEGNADFRHLTECFTAQ